MLVQNQSIPGLGLGLRLEVRLGLGLGQRWHILTFKWGTRWWSWSGLLWRWFLSSIQSLTLWGLFYNFSSSQNLECVGFLTTLYSYNCQPASNIWCITNWVPLPELVPFHLVFQFANRCCFSSSWTDQSGWLAASYSSILRGAPRQRISVVRTFVYFYFCICLFVCLSI